MFVRMLRRPRHHHGHERVSLQETNDGGADDAENQGVPREEPANNNSNERQRNPASANETEQPTADRTTDQAQEYDADDPSITIEVHPRPTTHPFLTSQISVERQIRQRRQSTCTLLLLFLLFRLWVEAILQKDVGLIFLSTMGTTWTYRYWCSHREEEEYDRQIEENHVNNNGAENAPADAASTFDPDLGLMSFQAQLALAILESQRQMFENGGYGGNDHGAHDGPGVTDEAKEKWKKYEWGGEGSSELKRLASNKSMEMLGDLQGSVNYGSVEEEDEEEERNSLEVSSKLEEGLVLSVNEEEPSCSICLCEYEMGESVMRLPCNHIYHESCLDSWVTNHVRCPLCNYDLMQGFEAPPRPPPPQQNNNQELFRRMMGLRRASARSTRRQLATMLAAMEDSAV